MRCSVRWFALFALLGSTACQGFGFQPQAGGREDRPFEDDWEDDWEDDTEEPVPVEVDVRECSSELSAWETQDNLTIAYEYAAVLDELRMDTADVRTLVRSLVARRMEILADLPPEPWPQEFIHEAGGVFTKETGSGDFARIEVRLFDELGPLEHDPFVLSNYLVDPVVETDEGGLLVIAHSGPGPLAPTLGWGDEPPSPVRIIFGKQQAFESALRQLRVEARLVVREHPGASSIDHEVGVRGVVRDMMDPEVIELDEPEMLVLREDLEQSLWVRSWELAHGGDGGLEGEVSVRIDGGRFPFSALYEWDGPGEPRLEIRCNR